MWWGNLKLNYEKLFILQNLCIFILEMSGEEILSIRTALKESQGVFGQRFNVTFRAVLNWEKGASSPSGKHMVKLYDLKYKIDLENLKDQIKTEVLKEINPKLKYLLESNDELREIYQKNILIDPDSKKKSS